MKIVFRNTADTINSFLRNEATGIAKDFTTMDRDGVFAEAFVDVLKDGVRIRPLGLDNAQNNTNLALTINQLYAIPFRLEYETQVDQLIFNVTIGSSGKVRVGIYADDGTFYPGSLVVESGEVTISSTGTKTTTIATTSFQPGIYWAVLITDTANNLTAYAVPGPFNIGFDPGLGSLASIANYFSASLAYGALPASFPAGAAYGTGTIPAIFWREL